MKAAEIIQLKIDLSNRLEMLRNQLRIPETNPHQEIEELNVFRDSSGFYQLFYYFIHYDRIRAAAEYEALVQLYSQPLAVTPEESDLLEIFGEGVPAQPFNFSPKYRDIIASHQNVLYTKILNAPSVMDKNQCATQFWNDASLALEGSETISDRVLARYIKSRYDLCPKSKPILMGEVKEVEGASSFINDLPVTSDHIKRKTNGQIDFSTLIGPSSPKKQAPPRLYITTIDPKQPIEVKTQTFLFGWIPCFLMKDIEASVRARQSILNQARTQIENAKKWAGDYFRPIIDGYKSLFEGWKNIKPFEVDKSQNPQNQSVDKITLTELETFSLSPVNHLLNYVASFIPGHSTDQPPAVTPTPKTEKSPWTAWIR